MQLLFKNIRQTHLGKLNDKSCSLQNFPIFAFIILTLTEKLCIFCVQQGGLLRNFYCCLH